MKNQFKLEECKKEKQLIEFLKKFNTPAKIQDFINSLKANFEENGETCQSPFNVLKSKRAHCIEAAFIAAMAIKANNLGEALVLDLRGTKNDCDHVIAIFQDKKTKKWGAISKSNHPVLRYREPIYRDIRELVMSYFHEYSDSQGNKTLREYSVPINLSIFDNTCWKTASDNLWHMHDYLDSVPHFNILTREQEKNLRKQDKIEISLDKILEYKKPKRKLNL